MRACRSPRRTAAPRDSWCRISTSGRAQSGCEGSASCPRTSPGSGNRVVITIMAIPGGSNVMTAIDAPLQQPRIAWQTGRVQAIVAETSRVKSIILQPANWSGHWPGQHVDIRLTADDGYQAERSYSIASPPEEKRLTLTVERVEDGEVSSYLLDELQVGDALEFRGPIGLHFIWSQTRGGPICLVAGGTGITPLMAMLRHRRRSLARIPASLIYSARSLAEIVYRDELATMARGDRDLRLVYALTREHP